MERMLRESDQDSRKIRERGSGASGSGVRRHREESLRWGQDAMVPRSNDCQQVTFSVPDLVPLSSVDMQSRNSQNSFIYFFIFCLRLLAGDQDEIPGADQKLQDEIPGADQGNESTKNSGDKVEEADNEISGADLEGEKLEDTIQSTKISGDKVEEPEDEIPGADLEGEKMEDTNGSSKISGDKVEEAVDEIPGPDQGEKLEDANQSTKNNGDSLQR